VLNAATGVQRWRVQAEGSAKIARVIVEQAIHAGAGDDTIVTLDPTTGRTAWSWQAIQGEPDGYEALVGSPALARDTVFLAAEDASARDALSALDVRAGPER
jgi:outer membrane protein assembly factor BamB